MASAIGLQCTNLCWVHGNSAIWNPPCSSRGPTCSAGPLNRTESTPNFGGFLNLSPFPDNKFQSPIRFKSIWTMNATDFGGGIVKTEDFGEPISLGTMQLPSNVDVKKIESLLFQWGNSLTQSATLPLPVPLKVDKVKGGIRLGFVQINEGKVEDLVHIDCLVFPSVEGSSAVFRALRNGKLKNETPPGEPMIMRSLLQALKKSIDLSRI
uniref:DUF7148 domain-containing protein n=1 Tax=Picea sitchensis TaxID=3332 RepID=A9NKZ7_PICSI|nr:unknown [Picea sitchensis]